MVSKERIETMKQLFEEVTVYSKLPPKCCGAEMKQVAMDYIKDMDGYTIISHNTPIHQCDKCGNSSLELNVAVLVEEMSEVSNESEVDFNEFGKLINSLIH